MIISATKKPITIKAMEWDGKNHRGMFEFLGGDSNKHLDSCGDEFIIDHGRGVGGLVIKTSEGGMFASIGDYIIKEPFDKERKFYPCKPDIFHATYDIDSSTMQLMNRNKER